MDENFPTVISQLEIIIKLLSFSAIKGMTVSEQVELLTKLGLKVKQIADITDKSENQVYVTQTKLRKRKKETLSHSLQVTQRDDDSNNPNV